MWHLVDAKSQKRNMERMQENFMKGAEDAGNRAKERDEFKKSHTCPHCGQCPPIPIWMQH